MTVAGIILAAGASTRMGRPKALLPWAGTTLLEHAIATLRAAGVEPVAVVGARADVIRRSVGADAPLVFNPRWPQGRATSLARGAAEVARRPAAEAILVQNVDQPTTVEVVERLLAEFRAGGAEAVQPAYVDAAGEAHGGHPVLLAPSLLPALLAASEASEGLRGILEGRVVRRVAVEDATVSLDLDTPEAYEEARARLGA